MYSYMYQGEAISHRIVQFTADTRSDIDTLPTDCEQGSTCLVIEDSSVWMLNSQKVWVEI